MSCLPRQEFPKTVAVVGGGLSGSIFSLYLSKMQPAWNILLIEKQRDLGRGVAYGACAPEHLLNVPVARMDIGLEPSFASWLQTRPAALTAPLKESGGVLADAFVPRQLFGDYLEQQVQGRLAQGKHGGVRRVHGEAVAVTNLPRQVVLNDGRTLAADIVVLATGHEPSALQQSQSTRIVSDPWAPGALEVVRAQDSVLAIGTGLTMVDVLLSLRARGHRGILHAISRHGLLPRTHNAGGVWRLVLQAGVSPRQAFQIVRAHVREATERGVPWQRVFDAVRPAVASVWHDWNLLQRGQFLRHLRAIWNVHRHRMAGSVSRQVEQALSEGSLTVTAGRLQSLQDTGDGVRAVLRLARRAFHEVDITIVINCTGPQTDLDRVNQPLLRNLLRQGLARPDDLGLGLDSDDCAVVNKNGDPSRWLFALGPLTRGDWWEIIATPEIRAQCDRLAQKIAAGQEEQADHLTAIFLDIGAGI